MQAVRGTKNAPRPKMCIRDRVKGHVLAVPGQVLPLHGAIAHHHVFRVPEGVLGIEGTVLKQGVLNVLEGVLSMKCNIAEVQFSSPHHEVLALGGAVLYGPAVGVPSKLRGNDIAVPQHRIAALPQGLDAVELGVLDGDMVRVPQGDVYKRQV